MSDDFFLRGKDSIKVGDVDKYFAFLEFDAKSWRFAVDYWKILDANMVDIKWIVGFDDIDFEVLSSWADVSSDRCNEWQCEVDVDRFVTVVNVGQIPKPLDMIRMLVGDEDSFDFSGIFFNKMSVCIRARIDKY